MHRRRFLASALATAAAAARPAPRCELGVLLYSFGIRSRSEKGFADLLAFLAFGDERGAAGVQLPLGRRDEGYATKVRRRGEDRGMYIEGIVRAPADRADVERFDAEVLTAKRCGAGVLRTVMLGGRRYEAFGKAEDYDRFAERALTSLRLVEPVVSRHGVRLAVENHKDFRVAELLDLLRTVGSEYVGVCVDTGNNLALLEEPGHVVEALAKHAFSAHLKDMGVEEYADGFLLAEVPLGEGILDLKGVVAALRRANPRVRLNLEMITRDPLRIPCLTEKYWATLGKVPGRDLARTMALVRRHARKERLPRISALPAAKQAEVEADHVRRSFDHARRALKPG